MKARRHREGISRRDFFRLLGGAAGASLFSGCRLPEETHINSGFLPTPEAPLTPVDDFFIVHNFGVPEITLEDRWRLAVRGLVSRELDLGFADLARFPTVTHEVTVECIGNSPGGGLISSTTFTGVRLADVLRAAGVDSRARGLQLAGGDGYAAYLPIEAGLAEEPLIVTAMGDEPLTAVHGAPVRALFPGKHGMFSVKWLEALTLTRNWATYGALTGLTNVVEGVTPVKSRIDALSAAELVVGTPATATGLALTAGTGVARVEVFAEEEWRPAQITFNTLDDERSPYLWSLWRFDWTPRLPGSQVLKVRAFDTEGRTQSEEARFPYDSGAIHSLRVAVRG